MEITFLYPNFLWGLSLVAIPVLIHLFNFRKYKTVYYPNVSLLKEVQQESKKTKSVRNWLVLLLRILAVIFLVLTFAYPIEKSKGKKGQQIVSLYIDNSFSMDAVGLEGNKFLLAKSFADQIIKKFEPNTKFQIITNDFLSKHQFFYSRDKVLDLISEIPISNKTKNIQSVLNRQLSLINEQENSNPNIYLISDFQALKDSILLNPDSIPLSMCLVASGENKNVGIDSVWFDSPIRTKIGAEKVQVKITNYSKEYFKSLPIYLEINKKVTQQVIQLEANQSETFSFTYNQPKDSIINGRVYIDDANLLFDNSLYFSYPLKRKTNVYVISDSEEFINTTNKLFANDSSITYHFVKPLNIDYSQLEKQNLIILGEIKKISDGLISELKKISKQGSSIAFFPSGKGNLLDYKNLSNVFGGFSLEAVDTSESQIETLLVTHSFFNNVFKKQKISINTKKAFPILRKHFPISVSSAQPLIFKTNGTPYLIKSNNLYFFSSGISSENSGLKSHALVVPLFYQLVFNAIKSSQIQYFTDDYINVKTLALENSNIIEIQMKDKPTYKTQVQKETRSIVLPANFQFIGHYSVVQNDMITDAFSVNNNRSESKNISQQIINLKALSEQDKNVGLYYVSSGNVEQILNKSLHSQTYWKLLLIIAFVCLILEMLVIRIFG